MAESVDLKKIRKFVEQYDAKLLATDKRFRKAVHVIHEEGTTMFFENAFLMKKTVKIPPEKLSRIGPDEDIWIIIFTEHHGFHIYHKDDLSSYFEYERSYKPLEELKL